MSNYDAWLEAPYQQRAAESDAYEAFCEAEDLDPAEDHTAAFEQYVDDMREDMELRRAEDRADMARDRDDYDW